MPKKNAINIKLNEGFIYGSVRTIHDDEDGDKLKVTVVASTEAPVVRYDWNSDESFNEVLDMKESSVRTTRLETGLSVLNTHDSSHLGSVLGITKGFSFKKKELILDVEFSKRDDISNTIRDIKDGIVKFVSIGYRVHSFKDEGRENEHEMRTFRAMDWEPLELSFVSVPADPGASIVKGDRQYSISVISQPLENTMPGKEVKTQKVTRSEGSENVDSVEAIPAANPVDTDAIRKEAVKEENNRVSEIRESCRSLGIDQRFADTLCSDVDMNIDKARTLIIAERSEKDSAKKVNTNYGNGAGSDHNPIDNANRGIENAFLFRMNLANPVELNENGRRFMGGYHQVARMMAVYMTETRYDSSVDYNSLSPQDIVQRTLTSSDFPITLANVMNKALLSSFTNLAHTYEVIVSREQLTNFHTHDRVRNEADMGMVEIGDSAFVEEGAATEGTIREEKEQITLGSYRKRLKISRIALINDNLKAFSRIPTKAAKAMRDLEARLVYLDTVIGNKALVSDSTNLFDSSGHNNATTGNALSDDDAINVVQTKMAEQLDLDGEPLSIMGTILLVPPALRKDGISHTSRPAQTTTGAVEAKTVIAQDLSLVVEPRLAASLGGSDTTWYIFDTTLPEHMIELATLQDPTNLTSAITVERVTNEGIIYSVNHDVAVQPMGYRASARSIA